MYRLQSEEGSQSKAAMLLWGEKLQWLVIRELSFFLRWTNLILSVSNINFRVQILSACRPECT
jgi:hypothetical protein